MDLSSLYNWVTAINPLQMAGSILMIAVGCVLIYLAIAKEFEPVLLLPIGFGCILANLGMSAYNEGSLFYYLYKAGIETEIFPLLIFIGVGAMIDFRPLIAQPKMVLLGAAGQFGIYGVLILAVLIGLPINEAAAIGSIGAIDGPDGDICFLQVGAGLNGCHRCGSVFLYEPDPHHPASHHEGIDHQKRASGSNGILAFSSF